MKVYQIQEYIVINNHAFPSWNPLEDFLFLKKENAEKELEQYLLDNDFTGDTSLTIYPDGINPKVIHLTKEESFRVEAIDLLDTINS